MFPRLAAAAVCAAALLVSVAGSTVTSAQDAGLREAADRNDFDLGAAVTADALATDEALGRLLIANVNMLSSVSQFDMAVIQPQPGVFDFGPTDALVDFAAEHDMTVRAHGLISRGGLPGWVVDGSWTPETLSEVLRTHVSEVVGRYAERNPGVVTQWDVVDEAFLPDGSRRPTIWQQVIGDDHLRLAFEAARAADPDALLFYDDFYDDLAVAQDAVDVGAALVPGATAERSTCDAVAKCVGIEAAISGLLDEGVPIDGLGLQAHLLSPDPLDLSQFSAWIEQLGLRWAVTEFDVPVPATEVADDVALAFQATTYADALAACVGASGCDTFVTWGITDRVPPTPEATGGAFAGGLWFDVDDSPKPAFDAMAGVLGETSTAPAPASTTPEASTSEVAVPPATAAPPAPESDGSSTAPTVLVVAAVGLVAVVVVVALLRRRPRSS
jgi:endo-1,4-beta-xylanase